MGLQNKLILIFGRAYYWQDVASLHCLSPPMCINGYLLTVGET